MQLPDLPLTLETAASMSGQTLLLNWSDAGRAMSHNTRDATCTMCQCHDHLHTKGPLWHSAEQYLTPCSLLKPTYILIRLNHIAALLLTSNSRPANLPALVMLDISAPALGIRPPLLRGARQTGLGHSTGFTPLGGCCQSSVALLCCGIKCLLRCLL